MSANPMNSPSNSTANTPDSSENNVSPPQLEELGTIEELTRGPSGGTLDGLIGGGGGFEDDEDKGMS